MDYLHFVTKNSSIHLHNRLARELRESEKRNMRRFAKLWQNSGSEKSSLLIHLNDDYFGRIRGEIIRLKKY